MYDDRSQYSILSLLSVLIASHSGFDMRKFSGDFNPPPTPFASHARAAAAAPGKEKNIDFGIWWLF